MVWILAADTLLPTVRIRPIVVLGQYEGLKVDGEEGKVGMVRALSRVGITPITRGTPMASDINLFGFKGQTIAVSVDGEKFSNACPNRMDVPIVRLNPMEVDRIAVYPQATVGSLLGGEIKAFRRTPSSDLNLLGFLNLNALSSTGGEAGLGFEGLNQGIYARYSRLTTYKNGEGKTFNELYGYQDTVKFAQTYYEGGFIGKFNEFSYNANVWLFKDVLFPYLMMDERESKTYAFGLSWKGNRLYANLTDHIMDNGLRKTTMYMRSDAKRMRAGLTGEIYDLYYDHWNVENIMRKGSTETKQIPMPNYRMFGATVGKSLPLGNLSLFSKLGIEYALTDSAKARVFVPFALRLSLDANYSLEGLLPFAPVPKYSKISFEISSSSPDPKEVFFKFRGMHKSFLGNYSLKQPIKFSLTFERSCNFLGSSVINMYFFSHFVKDYVELSGKTEGMTKIVTFENTDALLLGYLFGISSEYLILNSSYTFGKNLKANDYLSEIPPLSLSLTLQTPTFYYTKAFLRFNYNDAQTRVSKTANETPVTSFRTFDAGIRFNFGNLNAEISVNNLLNENYYTYLSYRRDPFASGVRVYEPGRTLSFSLSSSLR
jgi:iron complex outermembrane receptor protein